ncbi:hypothetical protein FRC11_007397, partial [Ceratobasidium sp. 423]
DNYVFDNEEYVAILQDLHEQDHSESTHSQTRGTGPSCSHKSHHVTIEEIEDKSDATTTSCTRSYVGKGKGKAKPKQKSKKCKWPSLGVVLDDLEGPCKCSIIPTEPQNAYIAYCGGGYLKGLVGSMPMPRERGRDQLRNKRAKAVQSISSGSCVSQHHAETLPRASLAPPRRPPMPPSPSELSGDDSNDSSYMHTSSNGGRSKTKLSDSKAVLT